jgi:hypothetical protein
MYNQHLLQIEHTVAEYQTILQEKSNVFYVPWLEKAPIYTIERCPFCDQENTEKINIYSLRGWGSRFDGGAIGKAVFHCEHFALTEAFVNFHGNEPPGLWDMFPPEVSHVIGYLLDEGVAQAVIHALPICRIEHDQLIPAYTAFLATHFSQHGPEFIHRKVVKFNVDYVEAGLVVELIDPPQGYEQWYDLASWVARGLLWWVDAADPALPIRTQDVAAFPYQNIHGRMWSHQFLRHAGSSYQYRGPRR